MEEPAYFAMPDDRRIAHRFAPGRGPSLVFLPGYMSDMSGSKATAVFDWARAQGRACLLLDYSGCGASSGKFADGTLTRWAEEVVALIEAKCDNGFGGPVVLIGSSMGGWLMLLVALRLGERVAGLIGVAAALHSADVQVTLIKDGDHRLSREADIALLLRTIAALVDDIS